jgi:hypothetical protein
MTRRSRSRIARSPRGGYSVRLPEEERALLSTLPGQLIGSLEVLDSTDTPVPPALRRLFPTAYPQDHRAEAAYVRLVREELVEHHRSALELLRDTAEVTHLDEAGLQSWLGALNDLRLALGSSLEVSEEPVEPDPDDPRYLEWVCYHYLSFLQSEVIEALAQSLPPPTPGADDTVPDDPWGEPLGGLRWDGTPLPETP